MGELMDKIIGSEENWEDGRLGLDEEHQVVVDETIDLQVDTSLGLVEANLKLDVFLNQQLEIFAKENGLIKKQQFVRFWKISSKIHLVVNHPKRLDFDHPSIPSHR